MLTPDQIKKLPDDIVKICIKLEDEIIADIARRIAKVGTLTETADYQILMLKEIGMAEKEIHERVTAVLKELDITLDSALDKSVSLSMDQDAVIYEKAGNSVEGLRNSGAIQNFIIAQKKKTIDEMHNLTKTLGFVDKINGRTVGSDINKYLYDTLNYTQFQIASGAFSPDFVIKQAVRKLADSGLRTIEYNSGHWNALDVAVRRAALTGIKQTTGTIGLVWADELDCDIMEITAHAGARPDHASWQGQLVSRSGQKGYLSLSDIGYGDVSGFKGANCRHDWNPFFPGISKRNYSDDELDKMDPGPFEYNGKVYHSYEAHQKQRQMETSIRETKRRIIAYDGAGAKDMMTAESVKLRLQKNEYETFSNKIKLREKHERHQVYGYNRSISSKSVWAEKKAKEDRILYDIFAKNWNEDFKEKAAETYKKFKSSGYIMDSHFIGRFLQRKKYKEYPEIFDSDIMNIIEKSFNFKQGDRNIYFDESKQIALVQNSQNKEFISFIRRKTKKGDWE